MVMQGGGWAGVTLSSPESLRLSQLTQWGMEITQKTPTHPTLRPSLLMSGQEQIGRTWAVQPRYFSALWIFHWGIKWVIGHITGDKQHLSISMSACTDRTRVTSVNCCTQALLTFKHSTHFTNTSEHFKRCVAVLILSLCLACSTRFQKNRFIETFHGKQAINHRSLYELFFSSARTKQTTKRDVRRECQMPSSHLFPNCATTSLGV